jgi:hypothetical protein
MNDFFKSIATVLLIVIGLVWINTMYEIDTSRNHILASLSFVASVWLTVRGIWFIWKRL